jgi:voltage-gated potassium channel Kch
VGEAKVFVLAIDDVEASLRTAELVKKHFPHVQIVARARNRFHASRLMDMGIERQIREALPSSLEMARWTLELLHEPPALVDQMVTRFARHDAEVLARQQAIDHDEGKLIQSSKEARDELVQILEEAREAFAKKERPAKTAGRA